VVKVTNALAAKFIEENLKYREERATETSAYASDELEMAKTVMDRKEAVMRDYKLKHYNELPEQRQTNVERLIGLQEQYQAKQESIQDLEKTMILIQDQISNRRKMIAQTDLLTADGTTRGGAAQQDIAVSPADRLVQLRALLKSLEIKYTENHPEIKRTKRQIARLEQDLATGRVQPDGGLTGSSAQSQGTSDPVILQLETQLKSIQLGIRNINEEKEGLRKTIAQYEEWVAAPRSASRVVGPDPRVWGVETPLRSARVLGSPGQVDAQPRKTPEGQPVQNRRLGPFSGKPNQARFRQNCRYRIVLRSRSRVRRPLVWDFLDPVVPD